MLELKCISVKTALTAMVLPIFMLLSLEVSYGESSGISFSVHNEIRISPQSLEGNHGEGPSSEYPKLITMGSETPVVIVVFLDLKSEEFVFVETSNEADRIINRIPSFSDIWWSKWPAIYVKQNEIYLVAQVDGELNKEKQYRLKEFMLDRESNQLYLKKDKSFVIKGRHVSLSNLFLYGDKFFIMGEIDDVHFNPLGLLSGHFPSWTVVTLSNFRLLNKKAFLALVTGNMPFQILG
jgi:hypothetical protein